MNLRSLGYQTELFVHDFKNRIEDRGDYIFVQTPSNPSFFWGNLLIFPRPPTPADVEAWPLLFAREFAHEPLVEHCTFAWDSVDAERGAGSMFVERGFKWEESVVLTAEQVHAPPKVNREIEVRPLSGDGDWEAVLENQKTARPDGFDKPHYEDYIARVVRRYRRMNEADLGHTYGAFLGGKLVADLGIFVNDEGLGRYQNVVTNPAFRRRGIAGTLVWKAAEHALSVCRAKKLVMVADEHDFPMKIYESVGFAPVERMIGVCRWPENALERSDLSGSSES